MDIIISILIIIFSSILHEVAHGLVAYRLGDPTAKLRGRLTLNPMPHIDPVMSMLIPLITYISSGGGFIFGGARPVPVDPFNLRDGRKDLAIVSLVGPVTNLILAMIASTAAHLLFPNYSFNEIITSGIFGFILGTIVKWNLILAIFNLVPIPPLDGSKVFSLLLPEKQAYAYLALESMGFLLLALFLFSPLMNLVYSTVLFALSLLGF